MKVLHLVFILTLIILYTSCNKVKDKTKHVINKSGEAVGSTATEFFEGVGSGIEGTLAIKVELSDNLKEKGVQTGKCYTTDKRNVLTVYLIFERDFKDTLWVKAFDKEGLEIGRKDTLVSGKAGKAYYVDLQFDNRTRLESKSKALIN
jgi:hypothetical protein